MSYVLSFFGTVSVLFLFQGLDEVSPINIYIPVYIAYLIIY